MKICPVCGDATFEDQPICFGCLHKYEDEDTLTPKTASSSSCADCDGDGGNGGSDGGDAFDDNDDASANGTSYRDCGRACPFLQPTTFRISLMPAGEESGGFAWTCTTSPCLKT